MSPLAMWSRMRSHAGLVRGTGQGGAELEGGARVGRVDRIGGRGAATRRERTPGVVRRAWTSSRRRARRRPSPSRARPPSQAWPVRRSQATTQSCKREAQRRQALVVLAPSRAAAPGRGRGRSPGTRRVRRGTAARRRARPGSDRAGRQAARHGERVRAGGRRLQHRHGIGRQVGPASVAPGSRTLEQGEPGQVAERLGGVDGSRSGDPVRQASQAQRGRRANRARVRADGDHAGMIRRVAGSGAGRPRQGPLVLDGT